MANYVAQVVDLALKKMHISSSLHITGECKGGSGWNGGGASAPRGYYYTQGCFEVYYYILIEHIEEDLVHQPLEG